MKMFNRVLFLLVCVVYSVAFHFQEKIFRNNHKELQEIPSYNLIHATTGYLYQLTAEIFFIKTAVFLGGVEPGTDQLSYAHPLANNLQQITLLYPSFIDPYYYSQAYLPHIGKEFTLKTNAILEIGIKCYQNDYFLLFFKGVNEFKYLDLVLDAAKTFEKAGQIPGSPVLLKHLSAILSAKGGNLYAGLLALQILYKGEENENIKKRYEIEIESFEKAIKVQTAVNNFYKVNNYYPSALENLIPVYLSEIPVLSLGFEIDYRVPNVFLKRKDFHNKK